MILTSNIINFKSDYSLSIFVLLIWTLNLLPNHSLNSHKEHLGTKKSIQLIWLWTKGHFSHCFCLVVFFFFHFKWTKARIENWFSSYTSSNFQNQNFLKSVMGAERDLMSCNKKQPENFVKLLKIISIGYWSILLIRLLP